MRGFLAFTWSPDDPEGVHVGQALTAAARADGWTQTDTQTAGWLGVRGPNPPRAYSPRPGALILGEVFAHPDAPLTDVEGDLEDETDEAFAARYSRRRWGRYVILFRGPNGALTRVFRDPSGGLAAHSWSAHGVRVVTSEITDAVVAAAPPTLGFDWDRIRALIARPFDLAGPSPLYGVTTVPPGGLAEIGGASFPLWSPETFARSPTRRAADARRDLRRTLDRCVSALAGRHAVGLEISGGLDSAIVGGTLAALEHPVALALNTRAPHPETDERHYAQAVAHKIDVDLTCRRRDPVAYSAKRFEATAGDVWPSQNGRDLANDQLVAAVWACTILKVSTPLSIVRSTATVPPTARRSGAVSSAILSGAAPALTRQRAPSAARPMVQSRGGGALRRRRRDAQRV